MGKLFRVDELSIKTNLTKDDVIKIAKEYIKIQKDEYEIHNKVYNNTNTILYDDNSDVTNTSVWYIDIISVVVKKTWPDACETLEISDVTGKVVCVYNDHGVMVQKYI